MSIEVAIIVSMQVDIVSIEVDSIVKYSGL